MNMLSYINNIPYAANQRHPEPLSVSLLGSLDRHGAREMLSVREVVSTLRTLGLLFMI